MWRPSLFRTVLSVFLMAGSACASSLQERAGDPFDYRTQREAMVAEQLESRDITDPAVLSAMRSVERHLFVPDPMRTFAYSDSALPIGLDQTISQPYIVALMTQVCRPGSQDRALEVGTGSGYQAAVLAKTVKEVFTIEIIEELSRRATRILHEAGYDNVTARCGDGYAGWPEEAPFDIILVTAAAPRVPGPLLEQLKEGGRLVIPVGAAGAIQELRLIEKRDGTFRERSLIPVRFVPMTGRVREP